MMAFTITGSGGWLKHSELVTVADTDGTYNSSALAVIGGGAIMTSVEEETGLVGSIQYTTSDAVVGAVGGIGEDPSKAGSTSTVTWVDLEVAANVGDSTLETFMLPKNTKQVRVQYTVTEATYGGDLGHAVDIYTNEKKSDLGLVMTNGIGVDPS